MTKKIEKITPDKNKQIRFFSLFKCLEVLGIFLFLFGLNKLGRICVNRGWITFIDFSYTNVAYWGVGLLCIFLILMSLFAAGLVIYLLYIIFREWIKANWRLAENYSLSLEDKLKLKKQKQRERHGIAVGDYFRSGGKWLKVKKILEENSLHYSRVFSKSRWNYINHLSKKDIKHSNI